jgi:Homeodomain-like domain
MRGPRPTSCIFPEDFLQEARQTARQRTARWQDVQRFRLVLLVHENPRIGNEVAGEQVGLSSRQVRRWRQRWAAGNFTVDDREGRGRKAAFSPDGPCLRYRSRL